MKQREGPIWFTTFTGKTVQPLSIRPEDIDIVDIAHALSQVCRFGGHTLNFYSVAEHSVLVADLVPEPVRLHALLHDAAEAYTGDLIAPLKYGLGLKTRWWKSLERRFDAAIAAALGLAPMSPDFKLLVKHADLVALATERRDVMPNDGKEWVLLDGIYPSSRHTALGMSPERAKREFLDAYARHRLTHDRFVAHSVPGGGA